MKKKIMNGLFAGCPGAGKRGSTCSCKPPYWFSSLGFSVLSIPGTHMLTIVQGSFSIVIFGRYGIIGVSLIEPYIDDETDAGMRCDVYYILSYVLLLGSG